MTFTFNPDHFTDTTATLDAPETGYAEPTEAPADFDAGSFEGGDVVIEADTFDAPALDPVSAAFLDTVPAPASSVRPGLKPVDILTGNNLLQTYYGNGRQNPTLDDMILVAEELNANTRERTFDVDDVRVESRDIDGQPVDLLICRGEGYKLSSFGQSKLLTSAGNIPAGWYSEQKAFMRQYILENKLKENPTLTLRTISVGGENIVRGITTHNKKQMTQLQLLKALKSELAERGGSYEVLKAHLTADMMSFRLILGGAEEKILPNRHVYRPGIFFQNSENDYCKSKFSPSWTCVQCLNGVVDLIGAVELFNQKNINVPEDAIHILIAKAIRWFANGGSGEIIDRMHALITEEVLYNKNEAQAVLNQFLGRIPKDLARSIEEPIYEKRVPQGLEDEKRIGAYDLVYDVTELAQNLNPKFRVDVEENVAGWLLGQDKKGKRTRATAIA